MRVMVFVKATAESEAGVLPTTAEMAAMGNFNERLVNAGIMRDGEGLRASSFGKRMIFNGETREVVSGPFAATSELVAGFWIWEVRDMDEALHWLRQCPIPPQIRTEIEIRPCFEPADFGDALTPEIVEQVERLGRQTQDR